MNRLRLVCLASLLGALATPSPSRADEGGSPQAAAPAWLRAPATRGPIAGGLAYDGNWAYGSLASGLPLGPRTLARDAFAWSISATLTSSGRPATDGGWSRPSGALLLDRSGARTGAWLGVANVGADAASGAHAGLRLGVGSWRSLAPFQVEGSLVTEAFRQLRAKRNADRDSLRRAASPFVAEDREQRSLGGHGTLRWVRGRLQLETSAGVIASNLSARWPWAQAGIEYQVTRRLLVLGSYGSRPNASLAFDDMGRPHTMIGLQFAPWAAKGWAMASAVRPSMRSLVVRRVEGGRIAIYVRCRETSRVELSGDFTDWNATALSPTGGGWWVVVLPVEPGLHRVRVRVDGGAWQAPPSLPRTGENEDSPAGVLLVD